MATSKTLSLHPGQMEVFRSKCRFKVVVAGRRWGKCGKSGTLIAMADGTSKVIEAVVPGDLILTINETTYALEVMPVQHVYDNGIKSTLRVVTRSGKRLEITPNHPLLANNAWTEAQHLKVGDLVAVPRVTVFGDREMPQHEVDLLAIWLAEGDHKGYTNETPEVNAAMVAAATMLQTEFTDAGYSGRAGLRWRWRGMSSGENGAIDLLYRYGLRKTNAKSKFIPDDIFKLPKSQLARFLNLFVACDGSINRRCKSTWAMEIGLANERMVRQLAELFLKFGIRGNILKKVHTAKSSVTGENFVSWRFIVSDSKSLVAYCEQIGAIGKGSKVDAACKAAKLSVGSCNSYLPISHDDFAAHLSYEPVAKGKYGGYNSVLSRDLPDDLRCGMNSWRKQTPGRVSERRYEALRKFGDGFFDPIADGDFAWDEIVAIENAGDGQTWDLSVEGNHNFIAEGIVTHNSALSRVMIVTRAKFKKQKIWYVAPTYRMAKQIMWTDMIDAIPSKWIRKINETTLSITLINGTRIELKGADKADSLRGVGVDFLVLDEFQDMSEDTWTKVLRPTLADRRGEAIFIGTPKSYNVLYQLYMKGQDKANIKKNLWQSWQFPTITSPFIPLSEIEAARADMDEKSFLQEFHASFEVMAGRVYYPFDRTEHVGTYAFNPKLPIWVGMDFNIDPMSTVVFQPQRDGELWAVDEIVLFGSNTEEVCDELEKRYWRNQVQIVVYPDPAGGARQHARGETDLDILREKGFYRMKYRKKHPFVADRVNAVNRMLKAANGDIRLRIDARCKHFIDALEQTIYKPGSRDVDKTGGIEHSADAAGYCIELEYSVRKIEIGGLSR